MSSILFGQALVAHGAGVVTFGTDVEDATVVEEVHELVLVGILVVHALVGVFVGSDLLQLLLQYQLDLLLFLVEAHRSQDALHSDVGQSQYSYGYDDEDNLLHFLV